MTQTPAQRRAMFNRIKRAKAPLKRVSLHELLKDQVKPSKAIVEEIRSLTELLAPLGAKDFEFTYAIDQEGPFLAIEIRNQCTPETTPEQVRELQQRFGGVVATRYAGRHIAAQVFVAVNGPDLVVVVPDPENQRKRMHDAEEFAKGPSEGYA